MKLLAELEDKVDSSTGGDEVRFVTVTDLSGRGHAVNTGL